MTAASALTHSSSRVGSGTCPGRGWAARAGLGSWLRYTTTARLISQQKPMRQPRRVSVAAARLCAAICAACARAATGDSGDVAIEGSATPSRVAGSGGELATQPQDRVVWAVNAGGDEVVGSRGVVYGADSAASRVASGGTEALVPVAIRRADEADYAIYQTERFGHSNFHYDIPVPQQEGRYTLVLKFAEVAFNEPGKKIFNVVLNRKHTVVRDLDIFARVGHAAAHDEYVSFTIKGATLKHRRKTSKLKDTIRVEFVKGHNDNPKICAIVLVHGNTSLAQSLVGVAPDADPDKRPAELMGPGGGNNNGGSVSIDTAQEQHTSNGDDTDDDVPFPLDSVMLGALILVAIVVYENYARPS